MNDAQYTTTLTYLRKLGDHMLLRDWDIQLVREYPKDDQAWAEINVCRNHDTAWVRVAYPEFFDQKTVEEQRELLVHELIHIHLDRPDAIMCELVAMFPENTACQYARGQHHQAIEFATHRLARTLAPFMPLPPKSMAARRG